jgi:hypothetical protein
LFNLLDARSFGSTKRALVYETDVPEVEGPEFLYTVGDFVLHQGAPWLEDTPGINPKEYDLEFGIAQVVDDVPNTGVVPACIRVIYMRCPSGNVNTKWQLAVRNNGSLFEGEYLLLQRLLYDYNIIFMFYFISGDLNTDSILVSDFPLGKTGFLLLPSRRLIIEKVCVPGTLDRIYELFKHTYKGKTVFKLHRIES